MPIARYQMPDGRIARFEVPEGTTAEQAQSLIDGMMNPQSEPSSNGPDATSVEASRKDPGSAANYALGVIKGASDIGATLLSPIDAAARALGVSNSYIGRSDRRQAVDKLMGDMGNTDSLAYRGGKLSSYVAGTAGVPAALTRVIAMIPGAAAALPTLLPALESGGMTIGTAGKQLPLVEQLLARATMGSVGGAASAGLVDPSQAKTGAAFGAALPLAVQGAGALGSAARKGLGWLGQNTIGSMTGTSGEAVRTAFESGKNGSTAFLDNVNNKVPMTDVLDQLKQGLRNMRLDRSAAYRSGMADISQDKTVLDMLPIQQAMDEVSKMGSFKGQVLNKNAAGTVSELADQVSNWAKLNPAEYHTPEGLDALKQSIGDIRDATQFGTPARRAADTVYNAIKKEITQQAPTYAKVMGDYAEASSTLSELERSLSAGEKSTADAAMRKLQSIMRNNAQTNYGNRLDMVKTLADKGGKDLMPALAGQAMNSWLPRGMVGSIEKAGLPAVSMLHPGALLSAPLMSPRLMGNAVYGLGSLSGRAGVALPAEVPMLAAPSMMQTLPLQLNYLRSTNSP